jgi:hypothetical protein
MTAAEAWRQYRAAEARVDRCEAAADRAGQVIAESQAAHWFAEWKAAEALAAQPVASKPAAA